MSALSDRSTQVKSRSSQVGRHLLGLFLTVTSLAGCAVETENGAETRAKSQHLTIAQSRVLGFEAPTQDWSTNNGSVVSSSANKTQGAAALSLVHNGYTQLVSVPIAATGSPAANATFQMQVPANMSWGTVELVFKSPSRNMWWSSLGSANIGASTGGYKSFSFPIPTPVRDALSSTATDITFTFVINAPNGQYLIDNLVVGGDTSSPPQDPPPVPKTFSLTVPAGSAASELLISATQKITIDDRSTLSRVGEMPKVASVGPDTSEFGAAVQVHADIVSHGDVDFVRS